ATGHLLGGMTRAEPAEHCVPQVVVAFQPPARPVPCLRLLLGIARPIADLRSAVPLQLARNRRWLAIQSCSDLPDRLPGFMKPGNRAALLEAKLVISTHGNT